jgi:phosphoenolpyruvate synthase/pyruvate phosphate dikinase
MTEKLLLGKVASEGAEQLPTIAAIVKIVRNKEDSSKINFGDVVIVEKLTTDFVSNTDILKKAKAIITEIGGETSHAVLLSREHGFPCLIDTKEATSTFEDEEFVEINLSEGFVKSISRMEYDLLIEQEKELVQEKTADKEEELREVTEEEILKKPGAILWFKDANKNDVGIVGGKGASLGEMHNKFPIPNGFCISAQAYEKEVETIQEQLMALLKIDINDAKQLEKASKEIEKLILGLDMNENLQKEILTNYNMLVEDSKTPFVAVRSSATAEDLPEASFAGQQATFLNVKGDEQILKAVKECWASLFTERAIYYREINNFKHEEVLISVVVQAMVDSEKAGVMFTVNPVTKNYDEILIEGNYGLGETVVSGEVTPDSYFISKKGEIGQKHISDKTWGLFRDENGGNVKKDIENGNVQLLSDEQIIELAEIGKKIEEHYDKPMDIEWAIFGGKFYILQARPITTL